jgi:hypothetical protein
MLNTCLQCSIVVMAPEVRFGLELGIRHAAPLTAHGVSLPATYVGAQGTYEGRDQINLGPLPASLASAGLVNLDRGSRRPSREYVE